MNNSWTDKISWQNTKEDIHQTAKHSNLRPWSLGCQCQDCDKEFSELINHNSSSIPLENK